MRLKASYIATGIGCAVLLIIGLAHFGDNKVIPHASPNHHLHSDSTTREELGSQTENTFKQVSTPRVKERSENDVPFFERGIKHYSPKEVLLPFEGYAPDTIHFVWCGRKWFEFKHLVAWLSIFKVQQPNKVIVHYWPNAPVMRDQNNYNDWYNQLKKEYYNIVVRPFTNDEKDYDCSDTKGLTEYIFKVLKNGGIYMNDSMLITEPLQVHRENGLTIGLVDTEAPLEFNNIGFMVAKPGWASAGNLSMAHRVTCQRSGK